jgi:hypothetical protein
MSLRLGTYGVSAPYKTNFFSVKQPWSACLWTKASIFSGVLVGAVSADYTKFLYPQMMSNKIAIITTTSTYYGSIVIDGYAWNHVGIIRNGNMIYGVVNGVLDIVQYEDVEFIDKLAVGGADNYSAAVKVWHAALTPEEIKAEMYQILPARFADLKGFYPLLTYENHATIIKDQSGNNNDLTAGSTIGATYYGANPPIPYKPISGKARIPYVQNKNMVSVVYGHTTAVEETDLLQFRGRWIGTGRVHDPGSDNYEALLFDSGQYMEMYKPLKMSGTVSIEENKYQSGRGTLLKYYKTGATEDDCDADSWHSFTTTFSSLGFLKIRFEAL